MDVFIVEEAWAAQINVNTFDGPYVRVGDNGLRCIRAPCPTTGESRLNSSTAANISEVDLDVFGDDEDAQNNARSRMYDQTNGIIIAGPRFTNHINGLPAKGREATQVFFRVGTNAPE